MPKKNSIIHFSSFFGPAQIICQTALTGRDAILMDLLGLLGYSKGNENTKEIYRAILERENDKPTIVAPGMALPHVRLSSIDKIVVAVATSKNGIVYAKNIEKPVKLIILILAPQSSPAAYLQAISSLAKICQDPATADLVAGLPAPEKVWSFFDEGGIVLPGYVRARDIMEPVRVKLQEYDNLEQAIDLFLRHGIGDLPVLDKDDNLVGVVTTFQLLRVCLPDYILWMDDLTPILNFEPFAEILRREGKTWLSDIMTTEYPTIDADAPAIQIAKEIIRQRVERAYVLRGRKLVGTVSLRTFLDRVLRG